MYISYYKSQWRNRNKEKNESWISRKTDLNILAPKGVTRGLPTVGLSKTLQEGASQVPASWVAPLQGLREEGAACGESAGWNRSAAGREEGSSLFQVCCLVPSASQVLAQDAQGSWHFLFTFKHPGVLLLTDVWKLTLRLIQRKPFSLVRGIDSFGPGSVVCNYQHRSREQQDGRPKNFNPTHLSYKEEDLQGKVSCQMSNR